MKIIYCYECSDGHRNDSYQESGTVEIECPDCGKAAQKIITGKYGVQVSGGYNSRMSVPGRRHKRGLDGLDKA